jgi:NitT/TauT family transport system permease protein
MSKKKIPLLDRLQSVEFRRGLVSIAILILVWEFGRFLQIPMLESLPAPHEVLGVLGTLLVDPGYWNNWVSSIYRVFKGFFFAQLIGIPLGLLMAASRTAFGILFPPFEILRPIPPLAWVPISIIFWFTTEISITFVIFLGAFYTVVINVVGGARNIDARLTRAAISLGARKWDIFCRIVLPATLPSIFTGMAVGMGITWEVVVAAEMIAGKSGLGYLTWSSYVGGYYPQIVIGMTSIGVVGYLSSSAIRKLGHSCMPWLRTF